MVTWLMGNYAVLLTFYNTSAKAHQRLKIIIMLPTYLLPYLYLKRSGMILFVKLSVVADADFLCHD